MPYGNDPHVAVGADYDDEATPEEPFCVLTLPLEPQARL